MKLTDLVQRAHDAGLEHLLIGGHAVIAHGYPRNTFDLDLAVPRPSVGGWRALVAELGYGVHAEGPAFLQFDPPDALTLPLDLMIVSEDTFHKLQAEAVAVPAPGSGVRTVSLRHLLALKAHAIRHGHAGRVTKDVDDVIGLVDANRLDVREARWREPLLKYGPSELYEKLLALRQPGVS